MDKRKRDSSPAAHPEHPSKRPCTTFGSQLGGEERSWPEVHAAQPERSTSPQPSTSGSQQHPEEPQISPTPRPSTSDYDSDNDSGYDSDSDVDFDLDSCSDSDHESDSLLDFDFNIDLGSDSASGFQGERSSSPPMSNSAMQVDQAQQMRTSQQSPFQEEVPEDLPGTSSEPEPPPPGLQPDRQQEEPISLFSYEGLRIWIATFWGC